MLLLCQADFFRALVLLKDGGVYADVDVLLAANLDVFITPTMSFFAPLDLVGADHDEAFCLWNGLIGTVPGHPILVETVEWLVNMILNRADAYDFERELCRYGGKTTPIWKLRQARILLLSGPCALGVAANRARGKANPVERIEVGWLDGSGVRHDLDDSLVLQVSIMAHQKRLVKKLLRVLMFLVTLCALFGVNRVTSST